MFLVTVDVDKCEGCEECVNVCPNDVLEMAEGKASPSGGGECEDCESCVGVCPPGAITVSGM